MQRHLPFDKAINFRDLGGYPTRDGGTVKWRRLFRSGHMNLLTEADVARLVDLGTAVICDFRSEPEREKDPHALPPPLSDAVRSLAIWPKSTAPFADVVRSFSKGELTAAQCRERQQQSYREFVLDFRAQYAAMFRLVDEAAGRPVVIHCTAGKDRTGIGAALLLASLGVPEGVILEDYLLSQQCPHLKAFIQTLIDRGFADNIPAASQDDRHALMLSLFGVDADAFAAAFDAMRTEAGSVDNFLRAGLGVDDAKRARLREWFVE
jgi:protein-tyrosine phosphatase